MADRALSMARDHAPWQAGTAWWVTGIQGVALILIGLYFLLAPASAGGLLVQVIALALLIHSVLQIVASFRAAPADPYAMLQAGIGATVGLLVALSDWLLPTIDARSVLTILGLGLLFYALVGVADSLLHRQDGESFLGALATALLLIILAIVLLTSSDSNALDRIALLGWIVLIGGALILFLAWRARSHETA